MELSCPLFWSKQFFLPSGNFILQRIHRLGGLLLSRNERSFRRIIPENDRAGPGLAVAAAAAGIRRISRIFLLQNVLDGPVLELLQRQAGVFLAEDEADLAAEVVEAAARRRDSVRVRALPPVLADSAVVVVVANRRPVPDFLNRKCRRVVGQAVLSALRPLHLKRLLPVGGYGTASRVVPRGRDVVPRRNPSTRRVDFKIWSGQFLGKGRSPQVVRGVVL